MLEVKNMSVADKTGKVLVDSVSLHVHKKEAVGLTGLSGSGKTTIFKSILGTLHNECSITAGSIALDGIPVLELSQKKWRNLCGKKIACIPQLPMTAFDRYVKIKKQMTEILTSNIPLSKKDAYALCIDSLKAVNLQDAERVLQLYPCRLSGGMLQRIIIALIISLSPDYILADEPASALDEENTRLFFDLLFSVCRDKGILLISHNMKLLQEKMQRIYIIENGKIIAHGSPQQAAKKNSTLFSRYFHNSKDSMRIGGGEWNSCH